jgi:pimeloyl-ACP methyl ester carboxylesterase
VRTFALTLGILVVGLALLYLMGRLMIARVETADSPPRIPLDGAHFIETRSGRVHYLDTGQGPAILLMHGSGRSIADWQEGLVQRLARHHRVIAYDYYGNGFSQRSAAFTYGYDLWVREGIDLLDALHVKHVTAVGQSVGGALACIMAVDYPARVDHVVTIGTGMAIEPQQFALALPGVGEIAFARMSSFGELYSPRHRAALEASFRIKGTRAAILQYVRRQMTVDGARLVFGNVFEGVPVSVLHLSGSRDSHISPDAARALAKRTHGKFVLVDGVGHNVHIEAPDRTAREIEDFLMAR